VTEERECPAGEAPGQGPALRRMRRYRRQVVLPGFGQRGQEALAGAHVAVIGAGGLGSPALLYLAGAGVGTISVVDDDVVELSNLHRQVIHSAEEVGEPKALSARRRMEGLNDEVRVLEIRERITAANAARLLAGADVVLDGSDNFATRHAVSAGCAASGIPHVWGSILGFEAQLSVFWAGRGPIYEDLYPEPPAPGSVPNCAQAGVLGPVVGAVGSAMALEALKIIAGMGEPLIGRIAFYSALEGTWEYIPLLADPARPAAVAARLGAPAGEEPAEGSRAPEEVPAVSSAAPADDAGGLGEEVLLVDVREREEFSAVHIPGAVNIPLSDLEKYSEMSAQKIGNLLKEGSERSRVVVCCASGMRSERALEVLRSHGLTGLENLAGGVNGWLDRL
jgi:molybdopterin/thiamine biosynthesis adenylyltransferase/rhodanese-related sulfurtransferase